MPISMHQASIPVFVKMLNAQAGVLKKAAAQAEARKIDPAALLTARLYPDMFTLTRQVQIACDFAKGCAARLAGAEIPKYEDNETSFAELDARIAKTVAFLGGFKPDQIDGTESKAISFKAGQREFNMDGVTYLLYFAMPNFYFHITTAYDILRHNGVEIGKRDFMGAN
jgi:hypothetical protein